ncbi:NADH dehydrogenase [ubiquinone] 1 alpha subcomplex assembly factor 2-like [Varroa jacobsoni]|uniref:NADH dehydrogenase [ubiquinone] 1 alpha subcomplex assembly factor 2 n=1 Tax=Varroa destructor TaxID=109461 RepID=A0A7M7MFB4_VARDE|nr:NADH dehydrogenase [ubiquinone] 1 alpha subcomplex assembly factor 2-like [Varroa destructor]XP_022657646.1 NADH dehydrogenase [ubiquinone] 1 alpha subcomplex assembly factor 2-like [Varroa destructor]XP_022698272.1 NADH dehydrogenase [ubiquinone] 1 alpha subcomplex assembly factor 2-like [Varroa jacobsoni]XP_022698273.1 NADH dehydrogenase [ubiquinone] 1 alpha subcomplex assembly factor 2-like [Varroa jacobsoni]
MAQRDILKRLVMNFVNSLRRPPRPKLCGEDRFGNKYYEFKPAEGSNLRQKRWFVPLNETRFDQEIPVEWEAWLRYRRSEPPMPEEIEANRIVQQQTIKNAKKLSGQRKLTSDLQKNPFSDFPDISEYEKQPGQGYIRIPEKPDPPEKK